MVRHEWWDASCVLNTLVLQALGLLDTISFVHFTAALWCTIRHATPCLQCHSVVVLLCGPTPNSPFHSYDLEGLQKPVSVQLEERAPGLGCAQLGLESLQMHLRTPALKLHPHLCATSP